MTDGSPLVSIRKSLARVKAEIVGMDVRVSLVTMIMILMMVMMMMMDCQKISRKNLTMITWYGENW